ncbi:helix-turn-helix transcriptional regulator [Neobacillus sp. 114]|uniref:helix-turn-helix domain-containing protein n=1 Tax=Neobacillus sp. 114 TaxID=3048535 RepID=UPI0024C406B1|nr:helix-turn-helix transcriptional regulator [Neobacillus sp. 114]
MRKDKAIYIGEVIKRIRSEKGLTQEELAHDSDLDRSYMSDLETNKKGPSLFTVFKLAKGLQIEPEDLVEEIKEATEFYSTIEKEEDD